MSDKITKTKIRTENQNISQFKTINKYNSSI